MTVTWTDWPLGLVALCFSANVILLPTCELQTCFAETVSIPTNDKIRLSVKRGLSGRYEFDHSSPFLIAKTDQSLDGPVLVRLERRGALDEANLDKTNTGGFRYVLRFFGLQAGVFDLADRITMSGMSDLEAAGEIESIWVEIISDLPVERGTDLYEIQDPSFSVLRGYRSVSLFASVLWLSVPILYFFFRKKPVASQETLQPNEGIPLSERLIRLAEIANDRELSLGEKAEFEWLFFSELRDRYDLPESLISSVPRLRRHAAVGESLRKLEGWLHSGRNDHDAASGRELLKLLMPVLHGPTKDGATHVDPSGGSA